MTIRIDVGNIGAGKTACAVRDLYMNRTGRIVYSNIVTRGLKNSRVIHPSMIYEKVIVKEVRRRGGEVEPVYDYKLNADFWKNIKEPISVVIDEAHSVMNSRRAMSKKNIIITDWLALIRRVLGGASSGYGELVLITQLPRRIDPIARDMASQVRYHRCHYQKTCKNCGYAWQEQNDDPEPVWRCPYCQEIDILKHNHVIEVWHFANMQMYIGWSEWGMNTFHRHYFINDIESIFPMYDTLQWDNMFTED